MIPDAFVHDVLLVSRDLGGVNRVGRLITIALGDFDTWRSNHHRTR